MLHIYFAYFFLFPKNNKLSGLYTELRIDTFFRSSILLILLSFRLIHPLLLNNIWTRELFIFSKQPLISLFLFMLYVFNVEIEKEKLCSSEDVDGGGAVATNAGGGSRGGGGGSGGSGGVSASLTPAIWEKTIPYDGETFHLEYMDLDEFLLENGIPVTLEEEELQKTLTVEDKGKAIPKAIAGATTTTPTPTTTETATPTTPVAADSSSPPSASMATPDPEEPVTVTTLQPAKLEEEEEGEEEEEEEQKEESLPEEATPKAEVKKAGEQIYCMC